MAVQAKKCDIVLEILAGETTVLIKVPHSKRLLDRCGSSSTVAAYNDNKKGHNLFLTEGYVQHRELFLQ